MSLTTHSRCHGAYMRLESTRVNGAVLFFGRCPRCGLLHFYDSWGDHAAHETQYNLHRGRHK